MRKMIIPGINLTAYFSSKQKENCDACFDEVSNMYIREIKVRDPQICDYITEDGVQQSSDGYFFNFYFNISELELIRKLRNKILEYGPVKISDTCNIKRIKYIIAEAVAIEAMEESREFGTIKEMLETIAFESDGLFQAEVLSVGSASKDSRINWKESRHVCTKRFGKTLYDIPQCIGFCSIE